MSVCAWLCEWEVNSLGYPLHSLGEPPNFLGYPPSTEEELEGKAALCATCDADSAAGGLPGDRGTVLAGMLSPSICMEDSSMCTFSNDASLSPSMGVHVGAASGWEAPQVGCWWRVWVEEACEVVSALVAGAV